MTTVPEFRPFEKIPRLNRAISVSEKIDGTNSAVIVQDYGDGIYGVAAQSRNRIITPDDDNYGFARWVQGHSHALATVLGEGYHYGEWWGAGIQRRYGLTGDDKRFSLFNSARWAEVDFPTNGLPNVAIVPVLYVGNFSQDGIEHSLKLLRENGSQAAPGFDRPEGVVIYHAAARSSFKVLIEGDETHKGEAI